MSAPHRPRRPAGHPLRLGADAEDLGRGIGQLVVTLLDVVRELLERQALRRIDAGDLDDRQIERLGQALQQLRATIVELSESFEVRPEDLRLPMNPNELLTDERVPPRRTEKGAP